MKHLSLFVVANIVALSSCANKSTNNDAIYESISDSITQTTDSFSDTGLDSLVARPLNDIRFENWEEEDWLDNEYISTLRAHLNDFHAGKIQCNDIAEYQQQAKSKFILAQVQPFIAGGLYITFIFLDIPEKAFTAWVYSFVDSDTEIVTGYEVRSIQPEDTPTEITREDLLRVSQENPLLKFW